MHRILANDGISQSGRDILEKSGFDVITTKVAPEQLENFIKQNNISVLLVRSATQVRKPLIDACPNVQLIGRGGVGMDNIDVDYAKSKGIHVVNTPASSSQSVAELVFGHLLNGVRFLHNANRDMPLEGDSSFKQLKKKYAKGTELNGKTLGVIGFGRIGKLTAKMAIRMGMEVIYTDHHQDTAELTLDFFNGQSVSFKLESSSLEDILTKSDFISLHVPAQKNGYILGKKEFGMMKTGAGIINASRGGIIDEVALLEALDAEKIAFAGLDVFESEPNPEIKILMHPKISLSPHIGASTIEAQDRIGQELANQVIALVK